MCWSPNPLIHVMVLGGGTFGRWLGHEGGVPINGISALVRRDSRACCFLCSLPSEDTVRRWPSANRSVGSRQTLICQCLDLRLSSLQIHEKWVSVLQSSPLPVYGALLWQPRDQNRGFGSYPHKWLCLNLTNLLPRPKCWLCFCPQF